MIITNDEALFEYNEHTLKKHPLTKLRDKCTHAATIMSAKWEVEITPLQLERMLNSRPKKPKDKEPVIWEKWGRNIFLNCGDGEKLKDPETDAPIKLTPKKGRPKSLLCSNPCERTRKKILSEQVERIETFASDHGLTNEDALEEVIRACTKKWNTTLQQNQDISKIEACGLILNLNLSTRKYTELRLFLNQKNIRLPPRNEIDDFKHSLHPQISSLELKSSVDFEDLIIETFRGVVKAAGLELDDGDVIKVYSKFGVDGSGNHRIRHQNIDRERSILELPHVDPDDASTYLLSTYCPLRVVKCRNEREIPLWENEHPNSIFLTRPVSLLRAKEGRNVIETEFSEILKEMRRYKLQPHMLNIQGKLISVQFFTETSMIDGKMVNIIQGDSGAHCHYCSLNREGCNNLLNIIQGFTITKSFEECKRVWDELSTGELSYKNPQRGGQCHLPIGDVKLFGLLHLKLRSLDFCLKLLYRLVGGQYDWSDNKTSDMCISVAKKEVGEHFRKKLGLCVDTPTGSMGNSNCGPVADRFFDPKVRNTIVEKIPNVNDRENFSMLLSHFNQMLTVTQSVSNKVVNQEIVKRLGIQAMTLIRESFLDFAGNSWIFIPPSVHMLFGHTWELFQITGGSSIGVYSEQAQEAWNKHVTAFKSGPCARARQTSVKENLRDIFCRMLMVTNPLISFQRRHVICNICGKDGHTSRSSIHDNKTVVTEEFLISGLYL